MSFINLSYMIQSQKQCQNRIILYYIVESCLCILFLIFHENCYSILTRYREESVNHVQRNFVTEKNRIRDLNHAQWRVRLSRTNLYGCRQMALIQCDMQARTRPSL